MKLIDKLLDQLVELSLTKGIALICFIFGISTASIWAVTRSFLNYKFTLTISTCMIVLLGEFFGVGIILYIAKKKQSKQKFTEGSRVILSTLYLPVMTAGKYNFLNGKVLCTWSDKGAIVSKWINQNQLVEYKDPSISPPRRQNRHNVW